jgi:hypothetical protein
MTKWQIQNPLQTMRMPINRFNIIHSFRMHQFATPYMRVVIDNLAAAIEILDESAGPLVPN